MSKAPVPGKSSTSFKLTIGLLSIPVKAYTATESAKIERHFYTADGREVGYVPAVKLGEKQYGEQLAYSDLVKKYETTRGLIELSNEEIALAVAGQDEVATVLGAQPFDVFDNDYVPSGQIWQLRAGGPGKRDKGAEKAYSLLLTGLQATETFLLVRWVSRGTVYIAGLFPTGTLYGLRYEDEIREERELPRVEHSQVEIDLAVQLLEAYREPKALHFEHPHAAVIEYAEKKAEGVLPQAATVEVTPTLDLANALQASIAAAIKQQQEKVPA